MYIIFIFHTYGIYTHTQTCTHTHVYIHKEFVNGIFICPLTRTPCRLETWFYETDPKVRKNIWDLGVI